MTPRLPLQSTYAESLDGLYVPWKGAAVPQPRMVRFNHALCEELGLDAARLEGEGGAALFSGAEAPKGAHPIAMAYAGHQFGQFSPLLGDGRALLLGEVIDRNGQRRDLHLKGSGRTPFSRGGDGKAVLGPVLREYLIGEAMHALGIPTTRALAAVTTGETIWRDALLPGAVLARVASSHIRVGSFQLFASRGEVDALRRLADYTIARHDADLVGAPDRYLQLLQRVVERQARLIAQWMSVGFVHGVMNTDNMAVSGETIDYGPCAFLDVYHPRKVFSSIDHGGRYAFGNQPGMAQWNLARFAESLLDLIAPGDADAAVDLASAVVNGFPAHYRAAFLVQMRGKLGLSTEQEEDAALVTDLFQAMAGAEVDFTLFFRELGDALAEGREPVVMGGAEAAPLRDWLARYRDRLAQEPMPDAERARAMNAVNPAIIPRNHRVEAALGAAIEGDLAPFDALLAALRTPFSPHAEFSLPPPADFGPYRTFCGT